MRLLLGPALANTKMERSREEVQLWRRRSDGEESKLTSSGFLCPRLEEEKSGRGLAVLGRVVVMVVGVN